MSESDSAPARIQHSDQDLNGVHSLAGTVQWEVRVGNAGNGADPPKHSAAITIAQELLG